MEEQIKLDGLVININNIPYKIKEIDGDYANNIMGTANTREATIFIDKELTIEVKLNTLLHEIFHVLFLNAGLKELDIPEELIVKALSNGMFNVLMSSPITKLYNNSGYYVVKQPTK